MAKKPDSSMQNSTLNSWEIANRPPSRRVGRYKKKHECDEGYRDSKWALSFGWLDSGLKVYKIDENKTDFL